MQGTGAASESARDKFSKAEIAYQNVLVINKQNPELLKKIFNPGLIWKLIFEKYVAAERRTIAYAQRAALLSAGKEGKF